MLQWYDGAPCSARYSSCMYLQEVEPYECLRRARECAWGIIRCPSGRTIVVDNRDEFVDCWFYITKRERGLNLPGDVLDAGFDMMGRTGATLDVPPFVMDALVEAFSLRRSRKILSNHREVERALRNSAVGDVMWMNADAVTHFKITNVSRWTIGNAVVRTTLPFHGVYQFEVLSKMR